MRKHFSHYFVRLFCLPHSLFPILLGLQLHIYLTTWYCSTGQLTLLFDVFLSFLFFLCFTSQKSENWKIILFFPPSRNFLLSTVCCSEEVIIHISARVHLTGTELQLNTSLSLQFPKEQLVQLFLPGFDVGFHVLPFGFLNFRYREDVGDRTDRMFSFILSVLPPLHFSSVNG